MSRRQNGAPPNRSFGINAAPSAGNCQRTLVRALDNTDVQEMTAILALGKADSKKLPFASLLY